MPMAGRGSRFANAGIKMPKPLISVGGKPMFLKALSSIGGIKTKQLYTVIIRKEHDEQYGLGALLKHELPSVNVIVTNEVPVGAVTDAMRAKPILQNDEGIIILDCDLWFRSTSYNKMVEDALNGTSDIAGGVLTFEANNPRYSYAKYGTDRVVTETAEKRVISDRAITGAYFFSAAQEFIAAAEALLTQPLSETMPEYYISPLYNIMIQNNKKVRAAEVNEFASFGTPEELDVYRNKTSGLAK